MILRGEKKNHGWPNGQKMMNNPKQFIQAIQEYDGDNIDDWKLDALKPLLD